MGSKSDAAENAARAADCLRGGGEIGALMRATDWSRTKVGPVESWPQSLRTSVSTCLNSRFPILIWWGRELVKIYNDAYRPILGACGGAGARWLRQVLLGRDERELQELMALCRRAEWNEQRALWNIEPPHRLISQDAVGPIDVIGIVRTRSDVELGSAM